MLINVSNFHGSMKRRLAAVPLAVRTLVKLAAPDCYSGDIAEKALRTLYHIALEPTARPLFAPYLPSLLELACSVDAPLYAHLIAIGQDVALTAL